MKHFSRKIIAVILSGVMSVMMCVTSFAAEEVFQAIPANAAGTGVITNSEVCSTLQSTVDSLSTLTAGVDYIDGEGVFIADTKEEAEKVAKEYGAVLKSYAHRIAVIQFPGSTMEALKKASVSSVSKAVGPNLAYHTLDIPSEQPATVTEEKDTRPFRDDEALGEQDLADNGEQSEVSDATPNDYYASSTTENYQYFHEKVNTLAAHDITTGKGAKIAVVDTGCTPDHEDSPFDSTHALAIDSISSPVDTAVGHGIHCTGIIHETKNNSLGGYGVAPYAEIYSVKIASSPTFDTSVVAEGMAIALEQNVNVISMSLGGRGTDALEQLVNEAYDKGVTVICAAGNECTSSYSYPAAYENAIAVAATDIDDKLAEYSNYGDWVDIAAPGSGITATYLAGISGDITRTGDNTTTYGCIDGTSMACPVVAGVAALMYASNPGLQTNGTNTAVDTVREILTSTTDGKEYVYGDHSVTGLVQADKAVEAAKNASVTPRKYSLVDMAGIRGNHLSEKIAKGKSVTLAIGDVNGKVDKKAAKSATWTSSDPNVLTVKNGKVKCGRRAAVGNKATITAVYGGETMTCDYYVIMPSFAMGQAWYTSKHGKYRWKKILKKLKKNAYAGQVLKLTDLSADNVGLVFSKNSNDIRNGTFGYSANTAFNYKVSIKQKALDKGYLTLTESPKGKKMSVSFNNAGKYKISFTSTEGSNQTFTYVVTVR
ncbi:MAG: S8 family serine peptidase [Lachnospiraceae bacterium]|nr:S8 family serine peptidase [Lachnospiraceae bacterium]